MNSRVAVASILQLVSRGTVSMLTCHIQKFVRAFAFGIKFRGASAQPWRQQQAERFLARLRPSR